MDEVIGYHQDPSVSGFIFPSNASARRVHEAGDLKENGMKEDRVRAPVHGRQAKPAPRANSRIYVNPEVFAMINKAAKELEEFQAIIDNEQSSIISPRVRAELMETLGVGGLRRRGGVFSQLAQLETRGGLRPPDLLLPSDSEIESPKASAGAVNVGFNRPIGELLSQLDDEFKARAEVVEQPHDACGNKLSSGESSSEGSGEEALEGESSSGSTSSLGSTRSSSEQKLMSSRTPRRLYTKSKSYASIKSTSDHDTHSSADQLTMDSEDGHESGSDGSDIAGRQAGEPEAWEATGAAVVLPLSGRGRDSLRQGVRGSDDGSEDSDDSSQGDDSDLSSGPKVQTSKFVSQVINLRQAKQEDGEEEEEEEHRTARIKAEEEIQEELRLIRARERLLEGEMEDEQDEEEGDRFQIEQAAPAKAHKRKHHKKGAEPRIDESAEAAMAARRAALSLGSNLYDDDEEEEDGMTDVFTSKAGPGLAKAPSRRQSLAGGRRQSQTGGPAMRRSLAGGAGARSMRKSIAGARSRRTSIFGPHTSLESSTATATFRHRSSASGKPSDKGHHEGEENNFGQGEEEGMSEQLSSLGQRQSNSGVGPPGYKGASAEKGQGAALDTMAKRISSSGRVLGNLHQEIAAVLAEQASAQRRRESLTGDQKEEDGTDNHHQLAPKKRWVVTGYIPSPLKEAGICSAGPYVPPVDPFARPDDAPLLPPPSIKLPTKPRPPPSARRIRELEEQKLREEEEEWEKQQRRLLRQRQEQDQEGDDIYTEVEDVLLMGEHDGMGIPVQVLTLRKKSDRSIVGRSMRVLWHKLSKAMPLQSAGPLHQDIPIPLEGLPSPQSPPPSSRFLEVVGKNATTKVLRVLEQDAALSSILGTQAAPPSTAKSQHKVPGQEAQKLGSRHVTVLHRPCQPLALLPHKGPPPPTAPDSSRPRTQHAVVTTLSTPDTVQTALPLPLQPPLANSTRPRSAHPAAGPVPPPAPVHTGGGEAARAETQPLFGSSPLPPALSPGQEDAFGAASPQRSKARQHAHAVQPTTLVLHPPCNPPSCQRSPAGPHLLRSPASLSPSLRPGAHSSHLTTPNSQSSHPPALHASTSADAASSTHPPPSSPSGFFMPASAAPVPSPSLHPCSSPSEPGPATPRPPPPSFSDALAGTVLASGHDALRAVAAAGYSAWRQRAHAEQEAQQQAQQPQQPQQSQEEDLWRGEGEPHCPRLQQQQQQHGDASGAVQLTLAQLSSVMQPPIQHPPHWNHPQGPRSGPPPCLPQVLLGKGLVGQMAVASRVPEQPWAPHIGTSSPKSSHHHHSQPCNGEDNTWSGPAASPTTIEGQAGEAPRGLLPHVMPHFLSKLHCKHFKQKADAQQTKLPDTVFLPRLQDVGPEPLGPERSCLSDASPWLQQSFKSFCSDEAGAVAATATGIPPQLGRSHNSAVNLAQLGEPGAAGAPTSWGAWRLQPRGAGGEGRRSGGVQQQQQQQAHGERIPLSERRAKGWPMYYPVAKSYQDTGARKPIYLGGFERLSPAISVGPLGSPKPASHSPGAPCPEKAARSSEGSPCKDRSSLTKPSLCLGHQRRLLYQQKQVLEQQATGGSALASSGLPSKQSCDPSKECKQVKPTSLMSQSARPQPAAAAEDGSQEALELGPGSCGPVLLGSLSPRLTKRKGPLHREVECEHALL